MRQKTIQAILAHAAKEYPRECCGVIAQKSFMNIHSSLRMKVVNF